MANKAAILSLVFITFIEFTTAPQSNWRAPEQKLLTVRFWSHTSYTGESWPKGQTIFTVWKSANWEEATGKYESRPNRMRRQCAVPLNGDALPAFEKSFLSWCAQASTGSR